MLNTGGNHGNKDRQKRTFEISVTGSKHYRKKKQHACSFNYPF